MGRADIGLLHAKAGSKDRRHSLWPIEKEGCLMKPKRFFLFAFRLAVVAALASVTTLPLAGQGARDQVKGTYFATGDNACLVSAPSLSPPGSTSAFVPASVQSSSVQGILTINPDGTGTGQFNELITTYPPASSAGASSSTYATPFTYTIADDGTLTVEFVSVTGTVLSGPSAGLTFSLNAPPLSGRIARDGTTMLLSSMLHNNTDPIFETLTVVTPTHPVYFERICHRTRVLIPVHVEGED
jgi:hypothetical protein